MTAVVWVVVALVYSFYLVSFSTFASTYASLSGLFAAMFFLYLSALVLLLWRRIQPRAANSPPAPRRRQGHTARGAQAPCKCSHPPTT